MPEWLCARPLYRYPVGVFPVDRLSVAGTVRRLHDGFEVRERLFRAGGRPVLCLHRVSISPHDLTLVGSENEA